jgi:hypothetical protein
VATTSKPRIMWQLKYVLTILLTQVLENRTKASQQEMEMLETLEELREMNSRHAKLDHEEVLTLHKAYEEQLKKLQDEEDEDFIKYEEPLSYIHSCLASFRLEFTCPFYPIMYTQVVIKHVFHLLTSGKE